MRGDLVGSAKSVSLRVSDMLVVTVENPNMTGFKSPRTALENINILGERLGYEGRREGMSKEVGEEKVRNGVIQVNKRESHCS